MNIALVTFKDHGAYHKSGITNEDDLLLNFLSNKGLNITKAIWNDHNVNWNSYDLVILKSPWDYFNLIEDFHEWLTLIEGSDIKLLNPIDIVKWNADKHYLQDIEKVGLNVTPSIFVTKGDTIDFASYFEHFQTEKLIVKPCVSGGSKNTFKVSKTKAEEVSLQLNELIEVEDFIIQPFLQEIEENGEWSFVFFGGVFSHAVLKKAMPGDFRVQSTFGGTVHVEIPPLGLIAEAQKYIDQFANNCLYARVDGAVVNNQFMLMELELIEPFLFLDTEVSSLENYYRALNPQTP